MQQKSNAAWLMINPLQELSIRDQIAAALTLGGESTLTVLMEARK